MNKQYLVEMADKFKMHMKRKAAEHIIHLDFAGYEQDYFPEIWFFIEKFGTRQKCVWKKKSLGSERASICFAS